MSIKESDWKIFCEIKNEAIQLYCERQLSQVIETITNESELADERFHFMCKYAQASQKQMKLIFDGHSRSSAFIQLILMYEENLISLSQFERLSDELKKEIMSTLERRA
ncbi:hypothetical protein EXA16_17690 [Vibrio cincinnatiensis]|uniref:hypothetical protein n=1 Tax=Vibrio cincinnatiensis TaxID=675 RepID=UPI001EDF88DF|nr:hypothetical protein [Vibrio cincinnatiensis]MCG3738124.1 hypothetical protein [Vibrio cincinnatiensis]